MRPPILRFCGSRMPMFWVTIRALRNLCLETTSERLGTSIPKCFFMAASRLQQIAHILQVPVAFFFEGAPNASAQRGSRERALSIAQIDDFVSDSNGLRLIGAFMRIDNADLRRKIMMLVQEIAGDDGN